MLPNDQYIRPVVEISPPKCRKCGSAALQCRDEFTYIQRDRQPTEREIDERIYAGEHPSEAQRRVYYSEAAHYHRQVCLACGWVVVTATTPNIISSEFYAEVVDMENGE